MRILIVTWNRNLVGGTEKYLQALMPGLLERGYRVGLAYEREADLTTETIDSPELALSAWCLARLGLESLMDAAVTWGPDVVYSQGLESDDLESALLARFPTILFAHGYYGTCGTGSKCFSFPRMQPCDRQFGPACALLHYPRRCGGLNPWTAWRIFQRQARRRARFPQYRAVVVGSAHMYREFLRHGARKDQLHLVPLAVTDRFRPAAALAPRMLRGRLLLVGRLTDVKGGRYLIEAIPRAAKRLGRPLTLSVVGDGPARPELEQLAARHQVAVEFAGWVDTRRKLDLMRRADLLVVPSLWPEPFGLVGIEAGSLGVPAVGFAVGGIPDWLIPGRSGELAPGNPPTVQSLADAIVRALRDAEHYAELCKGAWENACRFTLEAHLTSLTGILAETRTPCMDLACSTT
jgi:glycosyltransferase involved in cell wall biosynthesis